MVLKPRRKKKNLLISDCGCVSMAGDGLAGTRCVLQQAGNQKRLHIGVCMSGGCIAAVGCSVLSFKRYHGQRVLWRLVCFQTAFSAGSALTDVSSQLVHVSDGPEL